jgi:ATP-dependent Clp protease adapter protein ClpS
MKNAPSDLTGEMDLPESLADSKTSYQFIVASLSKAFEMQSSQASKLMSDNNKGLFKLCVQGNVNNDYTKVQRWY